MGVQDALLSASLQHWGAGEAAPQHVVKAVRLEAGEKTACMRRQTKGQHTGRLSEGGRVWALPDRTGRNQNVEAMGRGAEWRFQASAGVGMGSGLQDV